MERLTSIEFWEATAIRAIYTMAEVALGMIGGAQLVEQVSWKLVLSASVIAGIVSVLKSICVGVPEVPVSIDDEQIDLMIKEGDEIGEEEDEEEKTEDA